MTFPAWFEFHRDAVVRRSVNAQVLYAELLIRPRSFFEPVEVKTWAFGELLHMPREKVTIALDLLVARGYVQEHARAHGKAPRRVTVNAMRDIAPDSSHSQSA